MIDADVHRLEKERDAVRFRDGGGLLQPGDDVSAHLRLGHPRLVVSSDDRYHLGPELPSGLTSGFDLAHEAVVVRGIVQARLEAPSRELHDVESVSARPRGNGVGVLVSPLPKLDPGKAELGRLVDTLEEGKAAPPQLDVHGEACPRRASGLGRGPSGTRERGERREASQKRATGNHEFGRLYAVARATDIPRGRCRKLMVSTASKPGRPGTSAARLKGLPLVSSGSRDGPSRRTTMPNNKLDWKRTALASLAGRSWPRAALPPGRRSSSLREPTASGSKPTGRS